MTGIIHFFNQTTIEWYSKNQTTVQMSTYGSEFVSERTCVEHISDLCTSLRYLGVPIHGHRFMFGDNECMVNNAMKPYTGIHKRHNSLSFHCVREAIASYMIYFITFQVRITLKMWFQNIGIDSIYGKFYNHFSFGKDIRSVLEMPISMVLFCMYVVYRKMGGVRICDHINFHLFCPFGPNI